MENKILHTILNIIKDFKTNGASYYIIKKKIVNFNLNINLNNYLNYLIKKNCIINKKNKYFYLKNKINTNFDLLIDEEESDSELESIVLKKNDNLEIKNLENKSKLEDSDSEDFRSDDSEDSDGMPYFVFGNDEDDEYISNNNLQGLSFLLNIIGNQLEFNNDIKLIEDKKGEAEENSTSESNKSDSDSESDFDSDSESDKEDKEDLAEQQEDKRSVKLKFKTKIDDITLLNDGIVENKKKPDDEEFDFEFIIPYRMIYKILNYIK